MFWYFLRIVFSTYHLVFYRKAEGKNFARIKNKKPVLLALNHPNAFIDAIGFSIALYSPRTYYMARGDAFKEGFITTVLTATGIIPIFRMRDAGIEGLRKNNASFSTVYKLWNQNKKIIVFPEGLCIQERRLRPIQKGTARMAFGFMNEFNRNDFLIIPVSVNYSHPSSFRTTVYYETGEPIEVKEYYQQYLENNIKGVNALTQRLQEEMEKIVPSLEHKENDKLLEELQEIYKIQYIEENNLNKKKLSDHQKFWWYTIAQLNKITSNHPERVEKLRSLSHKYTTELKKYKINDVNIRDLANKKLNTLTSLLLIIIGFPFYAIGKLLNFLPWYAALSIARKTAKNIEFFASVKFVTGALIAMFYLIAELLILWFVFKIWWYLLAYVGIKVFFGIIALWYSDNKAHLLGALRLSRLKNKNAQLANSLMEERREILSILTGK